MSVILMYSYMAFGELSAYSNAIKSKLVCRPVLSTYVMQVNYVWLIGAKYMNKYSASIVGLFLINI